MQEGMEVKDSKIHNVVTVKIVTLKRQNSPLGTVMLPRGTVMLPRDTREELIFQG